MDASGGQAPVREPLARAGVSAWEWMRALAEEIGPRRPGSRAERVAVEWLRARLAEAGLEARAEAFDAYATFAEPHAVILGLGVAPGLLPRRFRRARAALGGLAVLLGLSEDSLRFTPLGDALRRLPSRNLVAAVEPAGAARRTLCLVAHVDSSRSGLIFHPRLAPGLRGLLGAVSAALAVQALEPLAGRWRAGRVAARLARGVLALGLLLLAEREIRGEDVPGANDNASGAAVSAALAAEVAARPLATTRLVLLVTGCEEAGTLGMRSFLDRHDTRDWLFLNFDGVAAPATLRYLPHEGVARRWAADPGLLALAERIASERPELGLRRAERVAGLTYDATPVLARGGRALTLSAQDGTIPNYHWPSDTAENADPGVMRRALEAGRALIAAIDRGDAD